MLKSKHRCGPDKAVYDEETEAYTDEARHFRIPLKEVSAGHHYAVKYQAVEDEAHDELLVGESFHVLPHHSGDCAQNSADDKRKRVIPLNLPNIPAA